MPDKLMEITYYIPGVTKPKTEYVTVQDFWADEELNVHARLYAKEKLPLHVDWRIVSKEELG
jgi:hypothetical protein